MPVLAEECLVYRRGLTLKKLFSVFFSCARLREGESSRESEKKSYCFLKWCFIINSERTLPSVSASAVAAVWLAIVNYERRGRVGCHPKASAGAAQGGALWPFSAGRLGSSSVPTYSSSLYKVHPKVGTTVRVGEEVSPRGELEKGMKKA